MSTERREDKRRELRPRRRVGTVKDPAIEERRVNRGRRSGTRRMIDRKKPKKNKRRS